MLQDANSRFLTKPQNITGGKDNRGSRLYRLLIQAGSVCAVTIPERQLPIEKQEHTMTAGDIFHRQQHIAG